MFVHLNCHSHYSLLAGADPIAGLVRAARAMQCPALALTDTNGLYGAVEFYKQARREGLHPIFGVALDDPSTLTGQRPEEMKNSRGASNLSTGSGVTLLAKNLKGFGELCRFTTALHLEPEFSLQERLAEATDDIIILSSDPALLDHVASRRGGANLYAELGPGSPWRRLWQFAKQHGLPPVATNRVFFIRPYDWEVHRLLSAIRTRTTVTTLPRSAVAPPEAWMKSPKAMYALFSEIPEAVCNTLKIAEQCDVSLPIGEPRLPPFKLPSRETASALLCRLARAGTHRLYGNNPTAVRRLEMELSVICDLALESYFLIVWDIVREAQARGIPTVGRGSAANSLVCLALGITQVDPLRYNLYFERFLSRERSDYPDIDIDFPWNRRDEMIEYVFDTYGHDHVALISTHVHFRSRSLIREVGKAMGVPVPEIDRVTKTLPHFSDIGELDEICRTVPECRDLPVREEPIRSVIAAARRIQNFPRHISIHCGGIVISPDPITDLIPLQTTPKGFAVTQYDMYPVEDMGLLKIDLLAQKGLAVLSDTVRDVKDHYAIDINFEETDPVADPETRALVKEGRTIGCFYIESPGMRNLLQKLGVETFEMLTAASSIIRPGVSDSGMMKAFIDRHNGKESVSYLHPKLEPILNETFGVMIYQEDVIKVANAIAGMSLGEAEGLRKCMSKKRDWEAMENYKERFITGAQRNGVEGRVALELWRQMESFAGYAFCKAHSASFALVSYQTAWLKTHYPAEFMAAVLSNQGGFYDTCAYAEEARRMGITILPPDVNESAYEFTAVRAGSFLPVRAGLRVGLMQVKHLSRSAIDSILDNRRDGPYLSLPDFLSRVDIDINEVEMLIRCGAADAFNASEAELLWQLKRSAVLTGRAEHHGQQTFRTFNAVSNTSLIPRMNPYTRHEKLWAELECLDMTVREHLLSLYDTSLQSSAYRNMLPVLAARNLSQHAGKLATLVGWLTTAKRTRTGKGQLMKFMTLEDATACFEVTLFPKVYRRFGHLLHDRGPFIVRGRVEQDGLCHTLTALWFSRLERDSR